MLLPFQGVSRSRALLFHLKARGRRIDEVTKDMVFDAFDRAGVPKVVVKGAIDASVEELPTCIERAAADLNNEGFSEAKIIAGKMLEGARRRLKVLKN